VERRLLAHELEIARKIQHSLLPKVIPSVPGFGVSGFCVSARQVGGDFYDVLRLSPDLILMVVADVMGKGVPAALFAATLRTLLRNTVQWVHRPGRLLSRINRLMYDDLSGVDMFITGMLALVDTRVGRLVVASAGHCPLLLADGHGEIESIAPDGMPLGIVEDFDFEEEVVPLSRSSCALLYTDGLTDARNPNGDSFGEQRLMAWFNRNATRKHHVAQLTENIQAELKQFQTTVAPVDDQTALILAPQPAFELEDESDFSVPIFAPSRSAQAFG
jgi:sigma-B regulation protein RsbU (phosphoserine phosphatase)